MHCCPNRACPSRGLETLTTGSRGDGHRGSRRQLFAPWDEGLLRSMPDLYRLTTEQLTELDGYGEISAKHAIDSIQRSKAQPFSRVLFGLNIPKTGWVIARNLARHFGSVDALPKRPRSSSRRSRASGPTAPSSSRSGSRDDEYLALVEELRSLGLRSRLARPSVRSKGVSRAAVRHHGHARGVVARRGEDGARSTRREGLRLGLEEDDGRRRRREPGSKLAKAQKLGVPVLVGGRPPRAARA